MPSVVVPSLKVTVPVGVLPDVALTNAVNVTCVPKVDVLSGAAMEVVVAAASMVSVRTAEVLVASSVSAV